MPAELSKTSSIDIELRYSPSYVVAEAVDQRFIAEQMFIDGILIDPPSGPVEDVAAVSHETNRNPDSRILLVADGKVRRLDGIPVDTNIEKHSDLGKREYSAFVEIEKWASSNDSGVAVWFSAPFADKYPVSKIDFGEIRFSSDQNYKILLKKAVLLDIDSAKLLEIANDFAKDIALSEFTSPEEMRSIPKFCTRDEMNLLLNIISEHTEQTKMIFTGEDLERKKQTYRTLSAEEEMVIAENPFITNIYHPLRRRAEEEDLIGDKSESCPVAQTAFQSYSGDSMTESVRIIRCKCPACNKEVSAMIAGGRITCLSCGASALYAC